MMTMRVCSLIMEIRQMYGVRRTRYARQLAILSRLSSRRERMRRGKMTSMRMIQERLRGQLRREDNDDIAMLNRTVKACREDIDKSMECLKEATVYMDDVITNPRTIRDNKYKLWTRALDAFLTEMKGMVEYEAHPGNYTVDILELLISRLGQMCLNERMAEQARIRFCLEEMMETLFIINPRQRYRMIGL